MDFFVSNAWAQGGAGAPPAEPVWATILPLVLFMLVFYFLLWRPQSKRQKEQRELHSSLGKGDEVVLSGGMLGRVVKVVDDYVVVEVANNMELRFQKSAVTATLPKGTIKNIQ